MPRDPFDRFRKIEKMFQKIMEEGKMTGRMTSQGISILKTKDGTKIDIQGDVSEEEVERLKQKYPNAEISVSGEKVEGSGPVEVLEEEESGDREEPGEGEPVIEEMDEEEMEPEELALKRLKEKKEEEDQD